jgi:radical SAM superfamily enzyme YgiQ (UPF0313 family)
MELAVRAGEDRFVAPGAYRALEQRLRRRPELADVPALVISAFDRRTRMLPFVFYDSFMFPAGALTIAGALHTAGFERTRAVFQLWNRNVRPSRARIDGRAVQMLLVSSMQIHAERAYELIADAHTAADRPLIIAGGAKAIYEPHDFWTGPRARHPPDVVVTGESFVLMELLALLAEYRRRHETLRTAFERARTDSALDAIPGLVYQAPTSSAYEPVLIDTGLQRLVANLDEFGREAAGLAVLEPPHTNHELATRPLAPSRVGRHAVVASVLVTQGCRFRCGYCPIPAVNQRSWPHRSGGALAHEIKTIHERYGIKYFFGADDNFFNQRNTSETLLRALANARACDRPFGERIRFATEATQVDTYKHRDLLLLGKLAGLRALWFGIEDLTATLVNKGQKPELTTAVFRMMRSLKIAPMAMLMFHDGQPFSTKASLYGLRNQIAFLRRAGAVTVQCTTHTPAVGTRELEATFRSGRVIARIGRTAVADWQLDGNHVAVLGSTAPWKRQLALLRGYAAFYNPGNFVRALCDRSPLRNYYIGYQAAGMAALLWTAVKHAPYVLRLMRGRFEVHKAPPSEAIPVRHPATAFRRNGTA